MWMRHVTHMNTSCHRYEWVMSSIWMSHVTPVNESCHTYEWDMSHIWMRHVTHMNETCHMYNVSPNTTWHTCVRETLPATLQHTLQQTGQHSVTLTATRHAATTHAYRPKIEYWGSPPQIMKGFWMICRFLDSTGTKKNQDSNLEYQAWFVCIFVNLCVYVFLKAMSF